jgi:glycine dehydrogenase subunit 1
VAELCLQNTAYLLDRLLQIRGVRRANTAPFFKETVVLLPRSPADVNRDLLKSGFLGGLDLTANLSGQPHPWLVCATEKRTKSEIDAFVQATREALS